MTGPVFYPWSAQASMAPVRVAGAAGCEFWDDSGQRWIDMHAQLANLHLGHQHPAMVAAISNQAAQLCTIAPSFAVDVREEAALAILEVAPPGAASVLFTNGGADANEHALRMARVHTGRPKILAAYRSYHGGSEGMLGVTGDPRRWPVDTGATPVVRFFAPYRYRSEFGASTDAEECERALQHLRRVIEMDGPESFAALIIEPVVGSNGVLVPPQGYLGGVRRLCDEFGILLVADEVITGFGRCGTWFGVDLWNVTPDLITFAKGVNSGYVPVGGVIISERVAATFAHRAYPGGLTYSGHPLASASIVASLAILRGEGLVDRAAKLGQDVVGPALDALHQRHSIVGEIRGVGLAWAIELVTDRATREPYAPYVAPGPLTERMRTVLRECQVRGVWPLAAANRLHLFPPLIITENQLTTAIDAIDSALTAIENQEDV
ncbi:aminotransferase class III-fold pyridoxal phosphate-dependent enzyme [Nonomuraea sp. NPDC050556]|uniref:aminotransferase class III-fold pyridoxal phosphate-dependent enzyme n=1 Tax=Nonomuraea sp. NPDC050556 TaxID=3364369 RepID=UPI0037A735AD